jgi:putative ABC transport system substrate-binding protein
MSYGINRTNTHRQAGVYAGPNPQGRKAGRLAGRAANPSLSSSSTYKRARALGLDIPPTLLARADEVIE